VKRSLTSLPVWGVIVCGTLAVSASNPQGGEAPKPPLKPASQPAPKPEPAPVAAPPAAKVQVPPAAPPAVNEVAKETPAPKAPDAPKPVALPPDLVAIKAEITQAKAQIDMTIAKLGLLAAATGDLTQPSAEASGAIKTLGDMTAGLKKRGDEMRERGAAYFESWEKQLAAMSTPEVVAIATKRKEDLSAKYAEVLAAMKEARATYDPFWADLEAIAKTIEDGLTPEKVKEIASRMGKTKEQATALKDRLDVVTGTVDQVAVIYSAR
jgi:hypothetical protein